MKKLLAYFLILLVAGSLLHQCNPIDLTAEYRDITVTYGFLNIKDDVHYFKIYRGYLTDDNAYDVAGEWDKIYYPVDSIEVVLQEFRNGQLLRSAVLDTTTMVPKDEGYFHNPKQLLYYSDWQLDVENIYKLVIRRHTSGDEIYAQTVMVGDFSIRRPMVSWNMCYDQPYKISFYSAENAAMYDLFLTFYYIEVDNATGAIEHKQISRRINGDYIRATTGNEVTFTGFIPETFFTTIIQGIETNNRVTRYIDSIDGQPYHCIRLTAWGADQNYLTYREVSNPGTSIVQNRQEYTNFVSDNESAYGLLASRNYANTDLMMDNSSGHNEDTLVKSARTRRLNFDYYRNSPEFPPDPIE
jgi:hypothetical protein